MDARHRGVRQSLFARGGGDQGGRRWEFVVLDDGGCALLCDDEPVATGGNDEASVERVLTAFLDASGASTGRRAAPPRRDADPEGDGHAGGHAPDATDHAGDTPRSPWAA